MNILSFSLIGVSLISSLHCFSTGEFYFVSFKDNNESIVKLDDNNESVNLLTIPKTATLINYDFINGDGTLVVSVNELQGKKISIVRQGSEIMSFRGSAGKEKGYSISSDLSKLAFYSLERDSGFLYILRLRDLVYEKFKIPFDVSFEPELFWNFDNSSLMMKYNSLNVQVFDFNAQDKEWKKRFSRELLDLFIPVDTCRFVFTDPTGIWLFNSTTKTSELIYKSSDDVFEITPQRDLNCIFFSKSTHQTSSNNYFFQLYKLNLASMVCTQLTDSNFDCFNVSFTDVTGKLLFTGRNELIGHKLFSVDHRGGNLTRVTNSTAEEYLPKIYSKR